MNFWPLVVVLEQENERVTSLDLSKAVFQGNLSLLLLSTLAVRL